MKNQILAIALFVLSPTVVAEQLAACKLDDTSATCQSYLEGIVDGALMYKQNAVGARLETDSYESRALKYRGGKRFQEANRTYCTERIPDRDELVLGVTEAVGLGNVTDLESLQEVVFSLLDCQRLK